MFHVNFARSQVVKNWRHFKISHPMPKHQKCVSILSNLACNTSKWRCWVTKQQQLIYSLVINPTHFTQRVLSTYNTWDFYENFYLVAREKGSDFWRNKKAWQLKGGWGLRSNFRETRRLQKQSRERKGA